MPSNKLLSAASAALLGFVVQNACCKIAYAKPKAGACAEAYEAAQELRKAAKLRRAEEMLLVCAEPSCGKFMHRECTQWLEQLHDEMPSVIFSAKDAAGTALSDVRVSLDGVLLTSALDGSAIAVDPGVRKFRFEAEGQPEVVREVTILPRQQERSIEVLIARKTKEPDAAELDSSSDVAASERPAAASNRSIAPYVVGGVGVLGMVGFGVLATLAKSEHEQLPKCLPDCEQAKIERVGTLYATANVSLGIGIVGLGTATVLFLTSSGSSEARTARPSRKAKLQAFDVRHTREGVYAELRGRF
jgi:hypothetical protein